MKTKLLLISCLLMSALHAQVATTGLPAATSLATTDLLNVTVNPGGTPASRKATIALLFDLLDGQTMTFTGKTISGSANTLTDIAWSSLVSTPTTLAGYGITDAVSEADLDAYQPLDSDLTSIAALTTTSFGRGLLTSADASALRATLSLVVGTNVQAWSAALDTFSANGSSHYLARANHTGTQAWSTITGTPTTLAGYGISDAITSAAVAAEYQPLDSDLTSIAALTTTSFGRGLLTSADASALRATLSLVVGTNVQAWSAALDTFSANGSSHYLSRANHTGTQTMSTVSDAGALATLSAVGSAQITDGSIANADISGSAAIDLSKLATDPLARANHTGTQAWSTITSTPTTLAGYGISDAITSAAVAAGYQPLDGDLTSIAALTTTSFGRGLLTETNAASLRTTAGLGSVENTALSTWSGSTNVTTLGTIATGTWNATAISTAKGGAPSGGTTGQVLTKSSNTSYDYAWATPSGGGGASISLPLCAWVLSTGNDTTGTVGDPSKPYATLQAAFDDGAKTYIVGEGTFAGISTTDDIDISIMGRGALKDGEAVKTTITNIVKTSPGGTVKVQDLGLGSCMVTNVGGSLPQAAAATAGGSGPSVTLTNLFFGSASISGQQGGATDGMNNGAQGGDAGTLRLIGFIRWTNTLYLYGGGGGEGSDTLSGGSGGASGSLDTDELACGYGGSIACDAGSPGTDGGAGTGSYGTSNNLTMRRLNIHELIFHSNSGATAALTLVDSRVRSSVSAPSATTVDATMSAADTWSSGTGAVTGYLSRINGTTY